MKVAFFTEPIIDKLKKDILKLENVSKVNTAKYLIEQEKYSAAYDAYPDLVHEKIMDELGYIKMAKQLWSEFRYTDAEVTLEAFIHKLPSSSKAKDLYDRIRADRATLFSLKKEKLSKINFHLDSISEKFLKRENICALEVRGWVALTQKNCDLLIDQEGSSTIRRNISIPRKDVVLHFKKKGLPEPLEICGFSFTADLSKPLTISLCTSHGAIPFVKISKEKVLQVLEGRNGWLFLDNDTNGAADIFTGKIPATKKIAKAWADFSVNITSELDARNIQSCIVISPSKEDVFPEYHPMKPASVSLVDTVASSIFISGSIISCPIRKLRQEPDSYYKTDTHWSHLGAWICTLDILELLNLPKPNITPSFLDIEMIGDLGSKIKPPRKSVHKHWDTKNNSSIRKFDNKVLGSGHVQIYENKNPFIDKSTLIFGGSSSSQLAMIMSNIFARTIKINTPTMMPIFEIVDKEIPDVVITQTNARYLVNTPKVIGKIDDSNLGRRFFENLPEEWIA